MQQVALNLYINNDISMFSVMDHQETGKTTLLKDIFANLIVDQTMQ